MKSKLRKEFEDYKKITDKRLFKLKQPPLFKFGEALFYGDVCHSNYIEDFVPCICKGVVRIEEESDGYPDPNWVFNYIYNIEYGSKIYEWSEKYLLKEIPKAFTHRPKL